MDLRIIDRITGKREKELEEEVKSLKERIEELENSRKKEKEIIKAQKREINWLNNRLERLEDRSREPLTTARIRDPIDRASMRGWGSSLWFREREILRNGVNVKNGDVIILADTDLDGVAPAGALVRAYKRKDPSTSVEVAPVLERGLDYALSDLNHQLSQRNTGCETVYVLDTPILGEQADRLKALSEKTEVRYIDHHPESKPHRSELKDVLVWYDASTSEITRKHIREDLLVDDPIIDAICEVGAIFDGKRDEYDLFRIVKAYTNVLDVYGATKFEEAVSNFAHNKWINGFGKEIPKADRLIFFTKTIILENKIDEDGKKVISYVNEERPCLRGMNVACNQIVEEDGRTLFSFYTNKVRNDVVYKFAKPKRKKGNLKRVADQIEQRFGGSSWGYERRVWGRFPKENWDRSEIIKTIDNTQVYGAALEAVLPQRH